MISPARAPARPGQPITRQLTLVCRWVLPLLFEATTFTGTSFCSICMVGCPLEQFAWIEVLLFQNDTCLPLMVHRSWVQPLADTVHASAVNPADWQVSEWMTGGGGGAGLISVLAEKIRSPLKQNALAVSKMDTKDDRAG
jgi:hypothetical protein